MRRSLALGFTPFAATLVGIPFVNSTHTVLGLPLLPAWLTVCTLAAPLFLWLAERALPERERAGDSAGPPQPPSGDVKEESR